jgi:hypothetical protein
LIAQEFFVVSKLEAAERQLDQAILLFFSRKDQVSIHTLATSAYQIISDICKKKGIEREIEDSAVLEKLGIKHELIDAIRKPQNFFKHADKDADQSVRLNPMLTACFMMSAVQYLLKLRTNQTAECEVFRFWFFLRKPEDAPQEVKALLGATPSTIDPDDYEFFSEAIELNRGRRVEGGAA